MMPLALDRISITLLMDNYTDRLLPSSAIAKRAPMVRDEQILPAPIAEHGFSAMVRIQIGQHQLRFLYDTGVSRRGMLANADLFGVPLDGVEAIILSHEHFDHFAGLAAALPRIGSPTKLVLHPDAFLRHRPLFPDGSRATMPYMDEEELKRRGAMISKNSGPTALPSKENPCLMVTGEIPRRTS